MPAVAYKPKYKIEDYDKGTYRDLPSEEPFELHPGCGLKLSVAPLFA